MREKFPLNSCNCAPSRVPCWMRAEAIVNGFCFVCVSSKYFDWFFFSFFLFLLQIFSFKMLFLFLFVFLNCNLMRKKKKMMLQWESHLNFLFLSQQRTYRQNSIFDIESSDLFTEKCRYQKHEWTVRWRNSFQGTLVYSANKFWFYC